MKLCHWEPFEHYSLMATWSTAISGAPLQPTTLRPGITTYLVALLGRSKHGHVMMAAATTASAENTPRRRLRNNYKIEDDVPPKPEPSVKVKIDGIPIIDYRGKIRYFTEPHDDAFACNQLVQWVGKRLESEGVVLIAFNLECPFRYQTLPGRMALMQLSMETDVCYVSTVLEETSGEAAATVESSAGLFTRDDMKNDFRKLARDYPKANADKMIEQCVDLRQWYSKIHESAV